MKLSGIVTWPLLSAGKHHLTGSVPHSRNALGGNFLAFLRTISASLGAIFTDLVVIFVDATNLFTFATDFPAERGKFLKRLGVQRSQAH